MAGPTVAGPVQLEGSQLFSCEQKQRERRGSGRRMSPKAIFAARPGTFKFSDRVVDLEVREIGVRMLLPD